MNLVAEKLGVLGLPMSTGEMATRDWDVVIVGGGHNGLACAAYLAKAGQDVLVLEARERLGGACTLDRPFADDRYIVSPCAYVIGVFDQLVIDELDLKRRGVRIRIADPAAFVPFDDGTAVIEWRNWQTTARGMREIGVSEDDIKGFEAYEELFDRARRKLRKGPRDSWVGDSPSRAELEELLAEPELIDIVFNASIADVIDAHVKDPRLQDMLYPQGLIAAYGGPRTPGTAMVHLMHRMGELEGRGGCWGYVEGGMGMVSFALADAAMEAGATIACGTPVAAVEPGVGVELEDGTEIRAAQVISNADPKHLLGMLGGAGSFRGPAEFGARLDAWQVRCPVVKFNAALRELPCWTAAGGEQWPAAGVVDCVRPLDFAQEAFEALERGEVKIAYAEIYSQTAGGDPTVAPPDRHVISAFCQFAPFVADEAERGKIRDEAGRQIVELIEQHAPGFEASIEECEVLTTADIEERVGLTGGQIFQGEVFPDQMWENRLSPRTPIDGLWLCGAATHPGGSVIGLNGRNAAMALLAERAPA